MSAENFIALFKNSIIGGDNSAAKAYSGWKINNRTWINKNRQELEELGLSKRVGFSLNAEVAGVLGKEKEFASLIQEIKEAKTNRTRGPFIDESNDSLSIIFPGVPFKDGIEKILDNYLGAGTSEIAKEIGFVKGHVLGLATGAIIGVKESLQKSLSINSVIEKEKLSSALKFLDVLIEHLVELDLNSSFTKNLTSKILSKYNKSSRHFLVELQLNTENSDSAKFVQALAGRTQAASTGIRGLMNPGGHQKALINTLTKLLAAQGFTDAEKLLKFKSSPPMLDLIIDELISVISGKQKKYAKTYSGQIDVGNLTLLYVNEQAKQKYKADLKKLVVQSKIAKTNIKKRLTTKVKPGMTIGNLESLLRSKLAAQIKQNMGTGNAKNVLNYRTGRFSESATIERATQSREGMVSVYYNYMRNPYGTFSEGGHQQSPKTRDPKALISKSIREIGASLAFARMRAVLV